MIRMNILSRRALMERNRQTPAETRQKIMEAAMRLFVERGYFNTSVPDIVRESNISIGSIYHHFENKQDLAKALYAETLGSFTAEMLRRTEQARNLKEKLRLLVNFLYELCDADPVRMEYMLFMRHAEIDPDHVPVCLSQPFQTVIHWLEEGIAWGEVIPGNADILAGIFMGGVLKVVELRLRGVLATSLTEVKEEAFETAWRAIGVPSTV